MKEKVKPLIVVRVLSRCNENAKVIVEGVKEVRSIFLKNGVWKDALSREINISASAQIFKTLHP